MPLDARQKRMVAYYCDLQQWQRAYRAANNDEQAIAYIGRRKAEALARLTRDWSNRNDDEDTTNA